MVSRINPVLTPGDIVTDPRSLAYYIVTEYGGVNLVGLQHVGARGAPDLHRAPEVPRRADLERREAGHLDPLEQALTTTKI